MLIAITGGIGSGKSVVSQILRVLGYPVYDCDIRAKWVMTHDPLLRQQLIDLFGPDTYIATKSKAPRSSSKSKALDSSFKSQTTLKPETLKPEALKPETLKPENPETLKPETLNRSYLSSRIFSDPTALSQMNACVHPAVQRDLQQQYEASGSHSPFFFESAILFESGFDQLSHPDQVWTVSAPLEFRIDRAMKRDQSPREKILARIHSQLSQEEKEERSDAVIFNDQEHSLIDQVDTLLSRLSI